MILYKYLFILALSGTVYADTEYDPYTIVDEQWVGYCSYDSNRDKPKCAKDAAILDMNDRLIAMESFYNPALFNWYVKDSYNNVIGIALPDASGRYRVIKLDTGPIVYFEDNYNETIGNPVSGRMYTAGGYVATCDNPSSVAMLNDSIEQGFALIIGSTIYSAISDSSLTGSGQISTSTCTMYVSGPFIFTHNLYVEDHTSNYPGPWTFTYERK